MENQNKPKKQNHKKKPTTKTSYPVTNLINLSLSCTVIFCKSNWLYKFERSTNLMKNNESIRTWQPMKTFKYLFREICNIKLDIVNSMPRWDVHSLCQNELFNMQYVIGCAHGNISKTSHISWWSLQSPDTFYMFFSGWQVEWIQQQVVKRRIKRDYKPGGTQSAYFNDPKWPSMWYMVRLCRVTVSV